MREIVKDETAEAAFLNTKTTPPDTGEERLPADKLLMMSSALVLMLIWLICDSKKRKKAK